MCEILFIFTANMASKTAERLCTGIGRTLVLLSITLGVRDPSQTGEEQVEPQLHPVAEEQPQEQPPEVVEATGSGEGQAVPVEGEAEVAGEGQAVPEEQELEEQRQESKGDRSSQVSKDASTMTEEIPGDVWFTLISSLESLEETTKKRRRKQEWPKAVAGTSSQFAREGQVLPKYKELEKKKQAICEDSSSSTEEELPAPTIMVKISSPSRSSAEVKMEVRGRKRKLESPKVVAGTSSQFAKEGQVLSKYKKLEKKKQAICEERSSSSTEEELPARSIVFTVSSPSRSSEEVKLELRERKRKQALPEAQAGPSSQLVRIDTISYSRIYATKIKAVHVIGHGGL
jgi:hypothetical protein